MDQLNVSEAARGHIEEAYKILVRDLPKSMELESDHILRIMFSAGYSIGCDHGSESKIDVGLAQKWCLGVLLPGK